MQSRPCQTNLVGAIKDASSPVHCISRCYLHSIRRGNMITPSSLEISFGLLNSSGPKSWLLYELNAENPFKQRYRKKNMVHYARTSKLRNQLCPKQKSVAIEWPNCRKENTNKLEHETEQKRNGQVHNRFKKKITVNVLN